MCREIAEKTEQSELYGQYANAPLIGRVGQALFETLASEELQKSYEANSLNWIQMMRSTCEPYISPIDKLRLQLDEAWPGGSTLGSLNGHKMFVGLARVFSSGVGAEPHQDILHWDLPSATEPRQLRNQFAANIYLGLPEFGGELQIWPESLERDDYERFRIPGSYGVSESKLKSQPVTIVPKAGELILFNSKLIHSVKPSWGGKRVTWSCFIGAKSENQSLIIWS